MLQLFGVYSVIQVGHLQVGFGIACAVFRWHLCHHGLHSRAAHVLPPFRDLKSYTGQMDARHARNTRDMGEHPKKTETICDEDINATKKGRTD